MLSSSHQQYENTSDFANQGVRSPKSKQLTPESPSFSAGCTDGEAWFSSLLALKADNVTVRICGVWGLSL